MKILKIEPGHAQVVYFVQLGDEDRNRTPDEMITAADNGGNYGGSKFHFGGKVLRLHSDQAKITVYVD